MQVVIQLLFNEIIDELIDTHAAGRTHIFRTQLHFRLTLEHRFLHIDSDRSHHTVTDIRQLLVLVKELLDGATYRFAISRLVCTALDGMLTVDEGEILITVLVRMRQCDLDIFAFDMNDRIQRINRHIFR